MSGCLALVLHAHLPFVRHPEHEHFLEENWLFEAITETYLPLLRVFGGWQRDGLRARLAMSLSPTLCAMLRDPLLQQRYLRHLNGLIELSEKEVHRTQWQKPFHDVAQFYSERMREAKAYYEGIGGDLVGAFRQFQDAGTLEILTCAATHAVLPLLATHAPSLRAQIRVACDEYRSCFGRDPRGIWLPECACTENLDPVLREANLRWFVLDSHGILHAKPRPRYGIFAPVFTPAGCAAFGRDLDSAKQVWSRNEGYPGDPRYRDFYRDIGFDLDLDYLQPYLPVKGLRGFTGLKYHRITGGGRATEPYERQAALLAAREHASHFFHARMGQFEKLSRILDRAPIVVSPYDAELFGHWWFEGPEFLDALVRQTCAAPDSFELITPGDYLVRQPVNQVCTPSATSWGAEGYLRVWLNESNAWIYPHLRAAQEQMSSLVATARLPDPLTQRALQQAGRELLLAQASDWPFILRTGTSPDYARKRVTEHLLRFTNLAHQISAGAIDGRYLEQIEAQDNLFPGLDPGHWRGT
jgi:1,4-alpha-glucan branching enzyme